MLAALKTSLPPKTVNHTTYSFIYLGVRAISIPTGAGPMAFLKKVFKHKQEPNKMSSGEVSDLADKTADLSLNGHAAGQEETATFALS